MINNLGGLIAAKQKQLIKKFCAEHRKPTLPLYRLPLYRVWQEYLMIWQHSCEWNQWHEEFFLEHPSSKTQSI
jgi:hypothetical protein